MTSNESPWKTHRLRAFIWAAGVVLVVALIFPQLHSRNVMTVQLAVYGDAAP